MPLTCTGVPVTAQRAIALMWHTARDIRERSLRMKCAAAVSVDFLTLRY